MQEKCKISFGSGVPRDTYTRKGKSSFMKYYSPEEYPNVAPCTYNVLESFNSIHTKPGSGSISKRGYSGLARFDINFRSYNKFPAPCDYSPPIPFSPRTKQSKFPFSSSAKRRIVSVNKNPGPGSHNPFKEKRGIHFDHSFGGPIQMRLPVEIKCSSRNTDACEICEEKLLGDYWHWNNSIFLCRPCMIKQRKSYSKFTRNEISQFRKLRYCSGIHLHGGTTAKLWLVHPKEIVKRSRTEAYLSSFFDD